MHMSRSLIHGTTTALLNLSLNLNLNPLLAISFSTRGAVAIASQPQLNNTYTYNLRSISSVLSQCPSSSSFLALYPNPNRNPYSTCSMSEQPTTTSNQNQPTQNQPTQEHHQENTEKKPPLALPPTDSSSSTSETNKLDLSTGSSSVKLDHLGPLVVNQDGTLSRIANWAQMTDIEKRNTLRVLGKRNQVRMAKLKGEGEGEGTTGNKGSGGD